MKLYSGEEPFEINENFAVGLGTGVLIAKGFSMLSGTPIKKMPFISASIILGQGLIYQGSRNLQLKTAKAGRRMKLQFIRDQQARYVGPKFDTEEVEKRRNKL